jgi:hypothetical protein
VVFAWVFKHWFYQSVAVLVLSIHSHDESTVFRVWGFDHPYSLPLRIPPFTLQTDCVGQNKFRLQNYVPGTILDLKGLVGEVLVDAVLRVDSPMVPIYRQRGFRCGP